MVIIETTYLRRYVLFFICICSFIYGEKITVFGIGRLGHALCLEKEGYDVLGVDISEDYIFQINSKTLISQKPRVVELLQASQNFRTTTSIKEGVDFSDIYIIAMPTNSIPGLETYDHSILNQLFTDINSFAVNNKHIVIVSTIFPGYVRNIATPLIAG